MMEISNLEFTRRHKANMFWLGVIVGVGAALLLYIFWRLL